jgi:hypothetical protein
MPEPNLPVESLREALPLLRRPFTPEAVKWKVQNVFPAASGCIIVAYIDARLVVERLNTVVADAWEEEYHQASGDTAWCFLTVFDRTHRDIGKATGFEKEKAVISDALKRAAVKFGVGVSVYALPQVTLYNDGKHNWIKERGKDAKKSLVLTDEGRAGLRDRYRDGWLPDTGIPQFGEPIDHGDVADAGGMEEEQAPEEFVAERPAALEDDRAKKLRADIEAAYEVTVEKGIAPTPGKFQAWLGDAAHSHAELERLLTYLRSMT